MKGIVEYIDAEEEENTYIALKESDITKDHTHVELDPLLILGVAASTLPYPDKNRGDRLNYGARMAVQSVGVPLHNYLLRDDTTMNVLVNPQKMLVTTQSTDAIHLTTHPSGQNLVIAIMPFYGYNIEDALIVNKSSLERGALKSISYRTHTTSCRRYWGGQEDRIGLPDKGIKNYKSEELYGKLDESGIIHPETLVEEGDILVGKISPLRFLGIAKEIRMGIENFRDNSMHLEEIHNGYVEKIILTTNDEGNILVKVSVRDTRVPEVGDKLATRHGQKGVIGLVVPEEDMPFTEEGITPDIIINSHAVPSRMTVGQILEVLTGKAGALDGKQIDATAFRGEEEESREILKKHGFQDDGKEYLYNGITGEKMEAKVLIGMCYYQRLYHMVSKKIHARARGPVALLTKQPTAGRSKGGGLRLGGMEKDCFVAHGAPIVLQERFSSDSVRENICTQCGSIAVRDNLKNKVVCLSCKSEETAPVSLSYAFKLLLDEMKSMMIGASIEVEKE